MTPTSAAPHALSPVWPADVPVPGRLAQLAAYVRGSGSPLLGDLELDNLADDFLVAYHGGDHPDLMERFPRTFAFFARSGGGGQVGLWMQGAAPADRWPVVSLDSEGGMMVAGETLDDFIQIMAGHWTEDDDPSIYRGGDKFRDWAVSIGLQPHQRSAERLGQLNPATLQLQRWFAEQKREIHRALHPDRSLVIDVVPGASAGPVRLGAPRAQSDAALGPARFATWEDPSDPEQTVFYETVPYVVATERASTTVTGVTLYAGHHLVRLPGGFEPMLATEADAMKWLTAHASDNAQDGNDLIAPSLGVRMTLGTGYHRNPDPAPFRWVTSLQFTVPT